VAKVTLLGFKCERCGHVWKPRSPDPTVCPHCHSPYWNKRRQSSKRRSPKAG